MNPLNLAPELLAAGFTLSYKGVMLVAKKADFTTTIYNHCGHLYAIGEDRQYMRYTRWCKLYNVTNFLTPKSYDGPNARYYEPKQLL